VAAIGENLTNEQVMAGILGLLAAEREDRLMQKDRPSAELRKTEVVLADIGLTPAQIGKVLGKKPNSVAKTISRARSKNTASETPDE
jgi:DNA-directed RNA polymerase specialized sigma24 family protein